VINATTIILGIVTGALLVSCQTKVPAGSISTISKDPEPDSPLKKRTADLLSYDDLVVLLKQKGQPTKASKKAEQLFQSPFVNNNIYEKYGLPNPTIHPTLGPSIRVTTWNIEKSIQVQDIAKSLSSEEHFSKHLKGTVRTDKEELHNALRQRADLAHSDILLLQEMDIGHCRSGYVFAAEHLAQTLGMNYAYAPQQLEIDPVYLAQDDVIFQNMSTDHEACKVLDENKSKYRGVFGVAVLSRYPIKKVQAYQLELQPYDWYTGEIQRPDFIEQGRRFGAEKIFMVKPVREVKVGGRGFTRVDLHVPEVPHETISVINIHLEIKTTPQNRTKQIEEILNYIHDIKNPVILAGDFNSAATDVSSTSLLRLTVNTANNPSNILSLALWLSNATGVSQARNILNAYKNYQDPLAWDVPILFPNKTKSLFEKIETFRFKDGGAFDFRGDHKRSMNGVNGILSNSNQRSRFKGFTQTFKVPTPIGPLGRERLDWIFVKSFLTHPKDKKGTYKLAPHFGETLDLINKCSDKPYSDHHPITTILPLEDPQ